MIVRLPLAFCLALFAVTAAGTAAAAEPEISAEDLKFFESEVRPLLAENCYGCHGPDKQKGGLRLDGITTMLGGGESGLPTVVPGKPAESLLIEAVNWESYEMPPGGKLDDKQIAALTKWVEMGAPWPGGHAGSTSLPTRSTEKITDEDRAWWAFQPVEDPEPPVLADDAGKSWVRNDIDRFILAKLREHDLTPAGEADKRTLIRRVTFDLTGLPPTPAEVASFVNDPSPDAYERLVDRLLDSPRYGERWARHWLDLVRYAESDGYKQDAYRPTAWRYRDYVIRSFNADKPYDQFVREQLAGDEIAPDDPDALIATGYLRHWIYEYNQRDCRTQWDVILTDVTDTTADVFLGLGMGCARCHDHKFDPILQKDYYRLRAFLAPILPRDDVPVAPPAERAAYEKQLAEWEAKTAAIREEIAAIKVPYRERARKSAVGKFPPDVKEFMLRPQSEWSPLETQLADLVMRQAIAEEEAADGKLSKEHKARVAELEKELAQFDSLKPAPLPTALTVTDVGPEPPRVEIPGRSRLGEIEPGIPTLFDPEPATIEKPDGLASTGRRTALANWITDPENPLSTRVIVNRIWQQHFGQGIVTTASDFGHLGEPPSHPELLDWLTSRFLENGWRLKPLHRLIVLSATYRQASVQESGVRGQESDLSVRTVRSDESPSGPQPSTLNAQRTDPENRLLWRQNVRRLDAEQVRDAILAATGRLDVDATGGPGVSGDAPRRSVYTKMLRNDPDPLLAAFDGAEGITSTARRNVTTTPTQALLLINGAWTYKQAVTLADRVTREAATVGDGTEADQVEQAYRLAYGRRPTDAERGAATAFLANQRGLLEGPPQGEAVTRVAMPGRAGHAVDLKPDADNGRLSLADTAGLPARDFTVEATFLLRSLYPDATVRTIVSHWHNDKDSNESPGWSLGVTSAKSNYQPRNLILQLVGRDRSGKLAYEVVASNLRPELGKPYAAAAAVHFTADGATVSFTLKDLTKPDAPVQTASVQSKIVGDYRSSRSLVIGGRDGSPTHRWDGLIDDVRLSAAALPPESLLLGGGQPTTPQTAALWRFEGDETDGSSKNFLADSTAGRTLSASTHATAGPRQQALIDLCHVLLNSNEFVYVD